jgi:hypothetical protein
LNKCKTLLFVWARPPRFLLGPAHVHPCATHASPLSLPPGPAHVGTSAPLSEQRRAARARRGRVTVGARPHDTVPRRVAFPRPDPPLSLSFSLSAAPPTGHFQTAPETLIRAPSPTPLRSPSRAPPPSPPFPRPYCCLRQPKASPSCRISPSATAVFPNWS